MIEETDLAYTAAFLDGEGCINISRRMTRTGRNYSYRLECIFSNNHQGVLVYLQKLWGGAIFETRANHFQLRLGAQATAALLIACKPYLKIKTEQADHALRFYDTFKAAADVAVFEEREKMFTHLKTLRI